ncbi:MAG: FtsX-like permease family protein [Gammaproteobacteria bacterium]|nr:FtsX-like permease family protein [Gammaproteobacteria bacterium]
MGIDPAVEFATLAERALPGGRPLERPGESVVGSILARNLGAQVGGDIIVLGTEKDGGVAATAVTLVGVFESGNADLDRSLMMVHFDDFSEAFGLRDEAHVIAVLGDDASDARGFAADISPSVEDAAEAGTARVRPWQEVQPELEQYIVMKQGGGFVIGTILIVIVTFVVVNAFVMSVFERTAEFGMLKAIGMPPAAIFRMVQLEGLWMSLIGVGLGMAVALAAVSALSVEGIPVSAIADELGDMRSRLSLPETLVPAFVTGEAVLIAIVMIAAVQFAAAVPAPRIWRLNAVDALRDEE